MQDFLLLKHGTIFYQTKSLCKTGVHLDLTKNRFSLYQKASDLVKSKECDIYLFVDVNCWLKVQIKNSKESFFSFISELVDLTNQENNPYILKHGAGETILCENV